MNKFNLKECLKECKKGAIIVAKYYLWVILLLFILDIGSKQLMDHILKTPGNSITIIPHFFSFTLVYNTGAAWGIFGGQTWLLVSMSVICGLAMLFFLIYKAPKLSKMPKIALSLMIPGAFGNLIDRAFYEKGVIDFLQFTFIDFPVFNMADSYLVIGIIILIIWYIIVEINDIKNKNEKNKSDKDTANLSSAKEKLLEKSENEDKTDDK